MVFCRIHEIGINIIININTQDNQQVLDLDNKEEKIRYAINYTKTTETFFESRDLNIQEISFVEKLFL